MMYKIILSSSSKKSLNLYLRFLTLIFQKLNTSVSLFDLPTTKKSVALFKSPHVYKKAKEHFELRSYKTILCFNLPVCSNILKVILLNKPKSVILKLKF
jgi:ribosomal protein S10